MTKQELVDMLAAHGFVELPRRAGYAPTWANARGVQVSYSLSSPEWVGVRCACTGFLRDEVRIVHIHWSGVPGIEDVMSSEFQEHQNLSRLEAELKFC